VGDCTISVRVSARASRDSIVGVRDGVVLIRVTAPPVEGQANAALCRLLAKRLGIGVRSVAVTGGARSRSKTVRIKGRTAREVQRLLHQP
jgi:uncharacterized protein (TIGR00251 family)